MAIRAITFDFWRTLFREANVPERRGLRAAALAKTAGVSENAAKEALKGAMNEFLRIHIAEQRTLQPRDALPMLEETLGVSIAPEEARELEETFATAILAHPPEPIDGALEAVRCASERVPVGVISDSGMSPGTSLEELLEGHGFTRYFTSLTFSDVVGVAKPQAAMFEHAVAGLQVTPQDLLHIGDLEPTDIRGALDFGARAGLFSGDNEKFEGRTGAHYTFTSWPDFVLQLPKIV